MKTNIDLLLNFIFTIVLTILIFTVVKINKDKQIMQSEINELRLLFNYKFIKEKITDELKPQDLTYKVIRPEENIQKFEF